jgi:hypothetical protein
LRNLGHRQKILERAGCNTCIVIPLKIESLLYNIIYKITVRTSQETHYFSTKKPNWVMLFRETLAVFIVRTVRNTQILSVGRVHRFKMLNQVAHMKPEASGGVVG